MKLVMISQPMNGKTEEEILNTKNEAIKKLTKEGYTAINSYFDNDYSTSTVKNKSIKYLSMSIEVMSKCDAVYFCKGWEEARGCKLEHAIAEAYGLTLLYEE